MNEKITLKLFNQEIASVDKDLLDYIKLYSDIYHDVDYETIIRSEIEKDLIQSTITCVEDIGWCRENIRHLPFKDIGEWVDWNLKTKVLKILPICGNCVTRAEDDESYCLINDCSVFHYNWCGSCCSVKKDNLF